MNNNFLRAFIIGSSILVVLPHFIAVANLDETKINYTYKQYTFIAPIYYGLMNMLSLYFALMFNLSSRQRYLIFGSLSPILVMTAAYVFKTYTYSNEEWLQYSFRLFATHFLIWNLVIFSIDKYI